MAAENVKKGIIHPEVPIYDAVIFCDLACEPPWVYDQVDFIAGICEEYGIPFYTLHSDLYHDHINRIRHGKFIKIPLWTMKDGKRGKLRRTCTIDHKIKAIQSFVRHELLGYRKGQKLREEDKGAHEMHIGFSSEERSRIFDIKNPMFINKYPLSVMNLKRKDNFKYVLEEWGYATKASACYVCPFHKNFFYWYLKHTYPESYAACVSFDKVLATKPSDGLVTSELYLTYSCKRLLDMSMDDYDDAETFLYRNTPVWNGF